MLYVLEKGLKDCGLRVFTQKCAAFRIINMRKTWAINDPELYYDQSRLPFVQPDEKLVYLGINIHPWKQGASGDAGAKLISLAEKCSKLLLKPAQKIELIVRHIIPKFLYVFIEDAPSPTYLSRVDDKLRQIFKHILHLASSVSNGFVYARKRDGGLGLPRLGTLVPLALLRAGRKLSDLNDHLVLNITQSDYFFQRMNTIIGSLRMREASWPLSLQAINKMKLHLKIRESEDWSRCISQGGGAQEFYDDPLGNSWLYRPQFFKSGQYIEAIKLRTNTTGVRTNLARCGLLKGPVICRKCLEA